VDTEFAHREAQAAVFPVPSMKAVQNHGAVEIMRGCPNGCRFCHAGVWSRPMRQKDLRVAEAEAEAFINAGGYREISLSSLSTGDYTHIEGLLESLNRRYASRHISFQLPSLRVSTFSLPILEKVSKVRRSGLTFAVETPVDAWQLAINKTVSRDNVVAILREARKNGWRGAKFYFMIGLPVGDSDSASSREETEIAAFIKDVARRTGMNFNINVGTFVPKPHTPYQWAAQIGEDAALKKLEYIRAELRPGGHKVGISDPLIAVIEGVLSRGDERVGEIIAEAFASGCRLDAWNEHIKKDVWRSVLERHRAAVDAILAGRQIGEPLPWDCIDSGTGAGFLAEEARKSRAAIATAPCTEACSHRCGVCPERGCIARNRTKSAADAASPVTAAEGDISPVPDPPPETAPVNLESNLNSNLKSVKITDPVTHRILFSFAKTESAVWLPHLSIIEVFSMAALRSGLPVLFSGGFNPLPKIDFASPISVGLTSGGEIATIDTEEPFSAAAFRERMNRSLPGGLEITEALGVTIPPGVKKHSAAALLWGYAYEANNDRLDYVSAKTEKQYRQNRIAAGESLFDLNRKTVLARSLADTEKPESYFTVYAAIYKRPD
jgi:uncharacterized protein (DUF2344 family)